MLAAGDAIGNHVLRIQAVLRAAGYDSRVYAEEIHPGVAGRAGHYTAFAGDGRILYHLSTSCPPMADLVAGHARRHGPGAVVVDYHHITPPEFFDRWEPWAAESARRARTEMAGLAPHIGLALADSSYSEDDLRASGYTRTAVVPILIDFAGYDGPGEGAPAAGGGGGARWLFVGRVAPNKCQHDVIGAFAVYRELFDPAATLTLVGGVTSAAYRRALG
ncbi:MAG: hypothetical protein ACRDY7_11280, partial [Acidimicrobiia bacterium]